MHMKKWCHFATKIWGILTYFRHCYHLVTWCGHVKWILFSSPSFKESPPQISLKFIKLWNSYGWIKKKRLVQGCEPCLNFLEWFVFAQCFIHSHWRAPQIIWLPDAVIIKMWQVIWHSEWSVSQEKSYINNKEWQVQRLSSKEHLDKIVCLSLPNKRPRGTSYEW